MGKTLDAIYGEAATSRIGEKTILVVGIGGIGCEVVKNLLLCGVKNLIIIDNDHIEVSNLNRQFYFTRTDINKSKALVVKEKLLKMYPGRNLEAYPASIQSAEFSPRFYRRIDIIISALDNREARKYISKMAVIYKIPLLIDAGAEGFSGQVRNQIWGVNQCYDCVPITTVNQSFPICSVRSIPTENSHCIIWAKNVYDNLFLGEDRGDVEGEKFSSFARKFKQSLLNKDLQLFKIEEFVAELFDILFYHSIIAIDSEGKNYRGKPLRFLNSVKSITDYKELFQNSFLEISREYQADSKCKCIKEDKKVADFIIATANVRKLNYISNFKHRNKIEKEEVFQVLNKIVPAIASTNAILAGVQVSEAVSNIVSNVGKSRIIWNTLSNDNKIKSHPQLGPKENCAVCGDNIIYVTIEGDFNLEYSLGYLIDWLKKSLLLKGISIILNDQFMIYEEHKISQQKESELKKNSWTSLLRKCGYQTFDDIINLQIFDEVERLWGGFYRVLIYNNMTVSNNGEIGPELYLKSLEISLTDMKANLFRAAKKARERKNNKLNLFYDKYGF